MFAPDGATLLTTTWEGDAYLWTVASGSRQAVLHGHESGIDAAAFSPDGSRVVTCSSDGTARVWDVATGEQMLALRGSNTVEFSPDGERILCGSNDGVAYLYDSVPWSRRQSLSRELAALEPRARDVLRAWEPACGSLTEAARR